MLFLVLLEHNKVIGTGSLAEIDAYIIENNGVIPVPPAIIQIFLFYCNTLDKILKFPKPLYVMAPKGPDTYKLSPIFFSFSKHYVNWPPAGNWAFGRYTLM